MQITETDGEFYIKDGFIPVGGRFISADAANLALSNLNQDQLDVMWMQYVQKFPDAPVDLGFVESYIEMVKESTV